MTTTPDAPMALLLGDTGGIPVEPGGALGGQVTQPLQVQYGDMLTGRGTSARWLELVAWRDLPAAQPSDTPRPQAHGAYPGSVWGDSLTVTYTCKVRGRRGDPDAKLRALQTLEQYAPMDGVDRPLVVDDGAGPTFRMARVIGRNIPMDKAWGVAPVDCSIQFLCADPRRYGITERTDTVRLPSSIGGLVYPLHYPLNYGESATGGLRLFSAGSTPTPPVLRFIGPLTDPVLTSDGRWSVGFNTTLADGEQLVVDTAAGAALLDGAADRLYTIRTDSDPLEWCLLHPGLNALSLSATSGTGRLTVTHRDARM